MKLKVLSVFVILSVSCMAVFSQTAMDDTQTILASELTAKDTVLDKALETGAEKTSDNSSWKYIAAAIAVGLSCIAGGLAVGRIGAAAMGAMSENPDLSGKALPYAGLAEGVCLWGFLVALLILVL